MPPALSIAAPRPAAGRLLDPAAAADHHTSLYRLARSLCGSPQLAEDVTQETFVRVLARPRRLHADGDFHYLARTLRNVLRDHWRSERRRTPPAPHTDIELLHARGDGDPEVAARAGELYAAVAELPDEFRRIVVAVDVQGMTYAEAARALGIPIGTVMSRLHRARARLAGALGEAQRTGR